MYRFELPFIFILMISLITGIISLKVLSMDAPENPEEGSEITLTCNYVLHGEILESVKWYHGSDEFYRFAPKAEPPGQVFTLNAFSVNLEKSDVRKVTLSNISLTASGTYSCEANMEPPSVATDYIYKKIIVRYKPMIPIVQASNSEKEHFRANRTYMFKYEVEATTYFPITTTGKSGFSIFCDIQLDAYEKYHYKLNVTSCRIIHPKDGQEHSKSSKFSTAIARYVVQFSMFNGSIEDMAAHKDEPVQLLNFKRGIISALLVKRHPIDKQIDNVHQVRTDVHGTCPVTYYKSKSEWFIEKHTHRCHFPSRVDWPYSPLSVIWNTSSIHLEVITNTVQCHYQYNSDGNLKESGCIEFYKPSVSTARSSTSMVQVLIKTNLTLLEDKKLTSWRAQIDPNEYWETGIQYEYERMSKPSKNPENFVEEVTKLLSEFPTDPEKEIDPETANRFDRLIELLRKSPDLSVLRIDYTQCWTSSNCTDNDTKQTEIQRGEIWRNALIQCNTAPCIRAFRSMLSWHADYLRHVVSKSNLHLIFLAWTTAKINDLEQIQEILEIAKLRSDDRFLITALAPIIHDYWKSHRTSFRSSIPSTLREFIPVMLKPMNQNCTPMESFKDADVRATLQAIANLGPLFQKLYPIYPYTFKNCIMNAKAHWSTSYLVIQATSNMEPTDELRSFLFEILKNSTLKHEDHAAAYLVLANKFGGPELVDDILPLLEKLQEDGQNNNFRTLIVTHLRATAKTWDHSKIDFIKAVREAMAQKPNLFRAIPEEKIVIKDSENGPNVQQIPWDIHLDDDLKFEEGYFSKYEETSFKLISPFLRDILKVIGYKINSSSLHNEESYLPYASWFESQAYGFGKVFKGHHLSVITKGVMDLVQKMASYVDSGKLDMATFHKMYQNAQEYLQKVKVSQQHVAVTKEHFPHYIDAAIQQTLANLHNKWVRRVKTHARKDVLLQYGPFATMTTEDLSIAKNDLLNDLRDKFMLPFNTRSNYWKVLEAASEFPTITGLPLRWTTDAYLINNLNLKSSFDNSKLNIEGSFSGIGTLKQGVHLDLPHFTSCGAEMFTTVSTSVGAAVDLNWNSKKNVQVRLELPQRRMQLFSFKRTLSMKDKYPDADNAEYPDARINESWCSDAVSPITGYQICHSSSFVNMSGGPYRPCTEMAGDSYWTYTVDHIAKHKPKVQFSAEVKPDEYSDDGYTFEAELKSHDAINNKFNTFMKLTHKVNSTKEKSQTEVVAPFFPSFHIKATKEPLWKDGFHVKADVTILPWKTTHIEYTRKTTNDKKIELQVKTHPATNSSSTLTDVEISETIYNYTSPTAFFGFSHKYQQFPNTTYSDTSFLYKRLKSAKSTWVRSILKNDMFWDNNDTASVNIHQEVKHSRPRDILPEESYTTIVLPKKIFKMTTLKTTTSSRDSSENYSSTFTLNITTTDPSTQKLLDFFNFTNTLQNKQEVGVATTFLNVNVTVPKFSCALQVTNKLHNEPPYGKNLTIFLKREYLIEMFDNTDVHWWTPANAGAIQTRTSSVKLTYDVQDMSKTDWNMCTSCKKSLFYIGNRKFRSSFQYDFDYPYMPPFEIFFKSTPTYVSESERKYKRNYFVSIPSVNTTIDGQLNFHYSHNSELLLWTVNVHQPHDQKIEYSFQIIPAFRTEGRMYVTESLNSEIYKRNSKLVLSFTPGSMTPHLDFNIIATSPSEPMLAVDLKLTYANKQSNLKVVHKFAEIDGNVNWQNDYTHLFHIKSKDQNIVPNLTWKADFSQKDNKSNLELIVNETDAFYTWVHTELNATRLVLDTFYQQNHTFEPDSQNFVAKIEFSLENPQELTRTVIYNQKLTKEINQKISQTESKTMLALRDYFRNSWRDSIILKWKSIAMTSLEYLTWQPPAFIRPFEKIFAYFKRSAGLEPIVANNSEDYFASREQQTEKYVNFCFTRLRSTASWPFSLIHITTPWFITVNRAIFENTNVHWYKPGPVPISSYVTTTTLPVYWTHFNRYPLQYSPSFSRMLNKFKENPYLDEEYTRYALLVGTGDIYTFDGNVLHLQQEMTRQCAYLLSHDIGERKFSIFFHDFKVNFVFPELSLTIDQDGHVVLNQTLKVELPMESWNRNIHVIRRGYLTEVTTPYQLKVVCSVEDFYCLFYTNGYKFNQVIGLLGNNNDNTKDDSKDPSQFELTGASYCKSRKFLSQESRHNFSTFSFSWQDLLWSSKSSTLPCHDIVSITDFFVRAYLEDPVRVPCPLMSAYLALCGAKGIMGDHNPCSDPEFGEITSELGRQPIGYVIFIIDQSQQLENKKFLKGVQKMADEFSEKDKVFQNADFGLVTFNGNGYWSAPQQHTLKGDLYGKWEDFSIHLTNLKFDGPWKTNEDAALLALDYAIDNYRFAPRSHTTYVVITPEDHETVQNSSPLETMQRIQKMADTVHVFSNYKLLNTDNMFGIASRLGFTETKTVTYPKSTLSKISEATNGNIWQLP